MIEPGVAQQRCYVLSGYELDPCLPADDTLLDWLVDPPTGCHAHVTAGPVAVYEERGRTCCYDVTCNEPKTRASGASF